MTQGILPATRARPHAKGNTLSERLAAMADEVDQGVVRSQFLAEIGDIIELALAAEREYTNKAGEPSIIAQPDFRAAMAGFELCRRVLFGADADEIIDRSEKVRRAFERKGVRAA